MQSSTTAAGIGLIRPRPPFDFRHLLGYLGRSPYEPLDVVANGRYRRALRLGGHPTLLDVRSIGPVDEPALEVRLLGIDPELLPTLLPIAERLVTRCFRVDEDLRPLEAVAAVDPVFGALLARTRGARALLMPSPFETMIWAIIGQQINITFAYKLKRALVERFGEILQWDGTVYRLFPEAARLADLTAAELREIQFSRQKAEYVQSIARLEAAGAIDWPALAEAPTEQAIATLTQIRGIGRWTAEYVCMRGLGHGDVIPAADLGLRAVIGRAYGLGGTATEAEVRALAESWDGWRSHAAFCWWYSLSRGKGEGEGEEARNPSPWPSPSP